jgi:hypothetical protein
MTMFGMETVREYRKESYTVNQKGELSQEEGKRRPFKGLERKKVSRKNLSVLSSNGHDPDLCT